MIRNICQMILVRKDYNATLEILEIKAEKKYKGFGSHNVQSLNDSTKISTFLLKN